MSKDRPSSPCLPPSSVYVSALSTAPQDTDYPELSNAVPRTPALSVFRSLLASSGLDQARYGSPAWNPLGEWMPRGARIVIKPNWVIHRNGSGCGLDCLITDSAVLEALLEYVFKTGPSQVVLGDAPIQGCDFEQLVEASGIDEMIGRFQDRGLEVSVRDFRQMILPGGLLWSEQQSSGRTSDDYVLFDLGSDSDLEEVTTPSTPFRVTMYDPDALRRTHGPGKHQYLVAREIIDADVVLNVPKLKTHKKAGLTGALKNIVGINGLKDFLPHHRKGGSAEQGDCYAGSSRLKGLAEQLLDSANRSSSGARKYVLARSASAAIHLCSLLGQDRNVEGSWHGNDTVWRMCLDLQRILHYGTCEGRLASEPARKVLTVTDALVAGEGEGPLAPTPVPLGMLTMGTNTAAVEWVNALLMQLDPSSISLVRESFANRPWLANFAPEAIQIVDSQGKISSSELVLRYSRAFQAPRGWAGRCELHSTSPSLRKAC